jgi:hypothetical protein
VGLLTGLLTLPLAPVRGVMWVAEVVAEEAEQELEALESPERALAELEAARLSGEVSDEEFAARQADLIELVIASRSSEGGR